MTEHARIDTWLARMPETSGADEFAAAAGKLIEEVWRRTTPVIGAPLLDVLARRTVHGISRHHAAAAALRPIAGGLQVERVGLEPFDAEAARSAVREFLLTLFRAVSAFTGPLVPGATEELPGTSTQTRVRHLLEIMEIASAPGARESAFSSVLQLVAETLPLRGAALVDGERSRMLAWRTPGLGEDDDVVATIRANRLHAWLLAADSTDELFDALLPDDVAGEFVAMPLSSRDGELMGLLQLHCATAPDLADVLYARAVSMQLAAAFDHARRHREALRSEDRLRRQLDFSAAVAESLGEAVVAVGSAGHVRLLNRAAESLFRTTSARATGKPLSALGMFLSPDGRIANPVDLVCRLRERIESTSQTLVLADGSSVPVSYACTPILSAGAMHGAVFAIQDITTRKHAEATQAFLLEASRALGASLDFHEALATLATLAVPFLADFSLIDVIRDGQVDLAAWHHRNPIAQRRMDDALAGRKPREIEGHPAERSLRLGRPIVRPVVTDKDLALHSLAGQSVLRGMGVRSMLTVPLQVGDKRIGALTLCHSDSGRRHTPQDVVVGKELAQRAAFALQNSLSFAEARRAIELREHVLAVVSHELRSPLGMVSLNAELIRTLAPQAPRSTAKILDAANRVTLASGRMSRLIEDLLDFASIEAGRLRLERGRHDAREIARDCARAFHEQALAISVAILVDVTEERVELTCDRERLQQVLWNLVANALKQSTAGGIVQLGVERNGDDVLFSVRDSGPGLSHEIAERLFEPFWRGDAKYRGTGLGLSIARGIVEAHGGRIWAADAEGRGARFCFTIPAPHAQPDDATVVWQREE